MKNIKIAIAGLGTVGQGIYEILKKDKDLFEKKTGSSFEIIAVSARSKKDFIDKNIKFYENAVDLASLKEVDVIIEVIGGDGVAKDLIFEAIKNGKKIITANKALLAERANELIKLLKENPKAYLAYEAAVVAAVPIIKTFKENLSSNKIEEFYGILNGTCNFISTKMEVENLGFNEALKQAQELGYAESDPTFDIKGIDAAHKLTILAAIASQTIPDFKSTYIEGVDVIEFDDVKLAEDLGYKIKLLGIFKNFGDKIQKTVYPALIPLKEQIAQVHSSFNAILTNTNNARWSMLIGPGAGKLETASGILADLADISNNRFSPIFGCLDENLSEAKVTNIEERKGKYFLKLILDKEASKNLDLSNQIFNDDIKIIKSSFVSTENNVSCGVIIEDIIEKDLNKILENLDKNIVKNSKFLRVENINSFE